MKEVNFKKWGVKNFTCHTQETDIEITNGKLTLFVGPNGSGKTSLFQAIPFALFGQCEKGKGEDVLNDKVLKNCHSFVEFDINNQGYRVDRYIKYSKFGTTAVIKRIGEEQPYKKGHNEVVAEVERLLMPYKLFMNSLLFSQKVKTFFTSLTDSEQKDIFRKVLKLDIYEIYRKISSDMMTELNNFLTELNQKFNINQSLILNCQDEIERLLLEKETYYKNKEEQISKLNMSLNDLSEQINVKKVELDNFDKLAIDQQNESIISELRGAQESLNAIDSVLRANVSELESRKKQKQSELSASCSQAILELQQKYSNLKQIELDGLNDFKSNTIQPEIAKLDEQILSFVKQESSFDTRKSLKEDEIIKVQNSLKNKDGKCPLCLRNIDDEVRVSILNEVNKLKKELETIHEESKIMNETLTLLRNKKEELRQKLSDETNRYSNKKKELDVAENEEKTSLESRLKTVLNDVNNIFNKQKEDIEKETIQTKLEAEKRVSILIIRRQEIQKLVDKRNQCKINYDKLVSDLNVLNETIRLQKERKFDETTIQVNEHRIHKLRSELKDLEIQKIEQEQKLKILNFWKTGFSSSGIQSMLIDEAIPFMNTRVSYYLDKISNGRYKVTFDTLKATSDGKDFRDKISVDVFDTQTHADKRVKFSGGQERIIDIATILTLGDLQSHIQDVKFNILLFDEIFDSLDEENITYVSKLLRQLAEEKWIALISHRHIDQIDVDEILEFH